MTSLTDTAADLAIPQAEGQDLHVRGLRAGYPTGLPGQIRIVVDDLSLAVPSGDVVALIGGNGTGKSTLLRAIVDPTFRLAGSVMAGATPIASGQLGYVPQQSVLTLFPWRTGLNNVALWAEIHGLPRSVAEVQVRTLIEDYDLQVPLDRPVAQLSGGERVKVALLRSLAVANMRGWILDEPFEGLDVDSRSTLAHVINIVQARGVPILVTSHRPDDVEALGARSYLVSGQPIRRLTPVRDLTRSAIRDGNVVQAQQAISTRGEGNRQTLQSMNLGRLGLSFFGFLLGLAAWAATAQVIDKPSLLPHPSSVGHFMLQLLTSSQMAPHFTATVSRALGSWVLAIAIALPLGLLIGYFHRLYEVLAPWLSIARAMPIFALVGTAAGLLAGKPEAQRVFLICLTVFLILLQITSAAAYVAPRRRLDLARIYGATRGFVIRRILLYETMGTFIGGLEVTLPLAIIVTLVVETFLIPNTGLGFHVLNNLQAADLSLLYASILLPAVVAATGVWLLRLWARRWRFEI